MATLSRKISNTHVITALSHLHRTATHQTLCRMSVSLSPRIRRTLHHWKALYRRGIPESRLR